MKKILGISAFYHDSAASLIIGNEVVAAVQEERFTRVKHTAAFPSHSIIYCLKAAQININDLDAIVFYDKPYLKFERLLKTYIAFAPRGFISFFKAMSIWLNGKLGLKIILWREFKKLGLINKNVNILFSEHHLSHACSAFYPSPFIESAILTIDGVGEWATASIAQGKDGTVKILKEMKFPHSVGLLYSAFTYFLGFKVNSGEYKLMGLAPYGDINSMETQYYIHTIKKFLLKINNDGSIWLNQKYFSYATTLKIIDEKQWENIFGFSKRLPETEIKQYHCNLALAIQTITEEIVIKMALYAKQITGSKYLCMAGGVALNCVANNKLKQENIFDDIYIQPAAGDAGGALGSAMAISHLYFKEKRRVDNLKFDSMSGAFLGPEYTDKDIIEMSLEFEATYSKINEFNELTYKVAELIAEGNIVGWFQDRMEFGPRALGNRSILADPRNSRMQQILNQKIKQRESFRPFAPSVLLEDVSCFFEMNGISPYMLFSVPIRKSRRKILPMDYWNKSISNRQNIERSDIQSVTHVDFSARVQTVDKNINLKFWQLISAFKQITNYGLLINTSFNVRGEPIVCTPRDAYRCFMSNEMDYLVINNFIFSKREQHIRTEKTIKILNFMAD